MAQTDYTYAVARIRFKETALLSDSDYDILLSASDAQTCIRNLKDKGWGGNAENDSAEDLISFEENNLWSFMTEIVQDKSIFNFILVKNDFHNLKVAIKCVTRDVKPDDMLIQNAVTSPELVFDAVSKREYQRLPEYLSETARYAMSTLLSTSDGQLCDMIVDRMCLSHIFHLKEIYDSDIIKLFCELTVASSDIKIAVRCAKTKKSLDFIKKALVPCDSLNIEKLAQSASSGYDSIIEYLSTTEYKSAVNALNDSMSAFEKWCDDYMTEILKPQKWEPFSIGPVIGYLVAKQNEIKAVRMILSAKINHIDDLLIRERLRKSYV